MGCCCCCDSQKIESLIGERYCYSCSFWILNRRCRHSSSSWWKYLWKKIKFKRVFGGFLDRLPIAKTRCPSLNHSLGALHFGVLWQNFSDLAKIATLEPNEFLSGFLSSPLRLESSRRERQRSPGRRRGRSWDSSRGQSRGRFCRRAPPSSGGCWWCPKAAEEQSQLERLS